MQNWTPERGIKREPDSQSPQDTTKLKTIPKNEDQIKHQKKKVKTIDKNERTKKHKLPKKECEVIGGAGWSLKINEQLKSKDDSQNESMKTNIERPVRITNLPNVVVNTLPEHKDSVLQLVLGDGACYMRCLAVHLGKNEEEGLELSKQYNKHLSKNREVSSNFISFPKTTTVSTPMGRIEETYKDTEEDRNRYFDYLETDEAIRMWREGEDMIAIATYFNVPIEVVVILRSGEVELPTQIYGPDGDYQLDTDVKPKITLLNSAEHFNLIIKNKPTSKNTENPKEIDKFPKDKGETLKCKFCEHTVHSCQELENHMYKAHSREIIMELKTENDKLREMFRNQRPPQQPQAPLQEPQAPLESLAPHWKYVPAPKPHKCDTCGNNFTTNPLLVAHIKNKHSQKTSHQPLQPPQLLTKSTFRFSSIESCEKCGKVFGTKILLEAHIKNTHNHEKDESLITENVFRFSKVINCNECGEECATQNHLKKHMQKWHQHKYTSPMETEEQIEKTKEIDFVCKVCKVERNTLDKLERHMANHKEDGDWYCEICSFQSNNMKGLESHMKHETHLFDLLQLQVNKCNLCEDTFKSKTDMAKHRRANHKTFKPCRNPVGCVFKEECFFNHDPIPEGKSRCFQCGEVFNTINEMMIHRKKNHDKVKFCKNYLNNQCQRGEDCWWDHETRTNLNQDFHQNPENKAPPVKSLFKPMPSTQQWDLQNQNQLQIMAKPNQTILIMMKTMEENMKLLRNLLEKNSQ